MLEHICLNLKELISILVSTCSHDLTNLCPHCSVENFSQSPSESSQQSHLTTASCDTQKPADPRVPP